MQTNEELSPVGGDTCSHDEFQAAYGAWITSLEELERIRPAWTELLQQAGADATALGFAAISTGWQEVPKPAQLAIVAVRNAGGRLVGVAPFWIACSAAEGNGARRLSFLAGSSETDALKALIDPRYEDAVIQEVARMLAHHRQEWDYIDLSLPGLMPLLDYVNGIASRLRQPVPAAK